jgi:hypothetical protein
VLLLKVPFTPACLHAVSLGVFSFLCACMIEHVPSFFPVCLCCHLMNVVHYCIETYPHVCICMVAYVDLPSNYDAPHKGAPSEGAHVICLGTCMSNLVYTHTPSFQYNVCNTFFVMGPYRYHGYHPMIYSLFFMIKFLVRVL